MIEFPAPPVVPECDCRDLDGFMLNVERLMASELVALSSTEIIGAAVLLWCRAWKQIPAASLPDDERVIASFAKIPTSRFQKVKAEILRGFVKCSDGRLYHSVLAEEARRAYARKVKFRNDREKDSERLRNWRRNRKGNGHSTNNETHVETRFERIGQGQGQGQGQVLSSEPNGSAACAAKIDLEKQLFERGKIVLGKNSGGLITNLIKAKGSIELARAAVETAATKANPREYVGACVRGENSDAVERGDAW